MIDESGWNFSKILFLDIHINPFNPLAGSSYIDLPYKIKKNRSTINVKNIYDNECFKWAITSAIFPKEKDPQRLNPLMRENAEKINWAGIKFPISLLDIDKFEKQNPYAVNVLGHDNGEFTPLRISKKKDVKMIRLLLISDEKVNQHYCWIKILVDFCLI